MAIRCQCVSFHLRSSESKLGWSVEMCLTHFSTSRSLFVKFMICAKMDKHGAMGHLLTKGWTGS